MVHITKTPIVKRFGFDGEKVRRYDIRCREYRPGAVAYPFEFDKTLPGSEAGRIKSIGNLRWLEQGLGKDDATAYLV